MKGESFFLEGKLNCKHNKSKEWFTLQTLNESSKTSKIFIKFFGKFANVSQILRSSNATHFLLELVRFKKFKFNWSYIWQCRYPFKLKFIFYKWLALHCPLWHTILSSSFPWGFFFKSAFMFFSCDSMRLINSCCVYS